MAFRYDNVDDASMQLDNTVMMTQDSGVVFLSHEHDWTYRCHTLIDYDSDIVDVREIGLTFEPLILGYVDYGNSSAYLERRPLRMWKAGLSYDNVKAISGYVSDELFQSPYLAKCLINDYPSLKDAIILASTQKTMRAFHRDVCIDGRGVEVSIEYKGYAIGKLDENLNFLINEKYGYLVEVLQEIIDEES